MPFFENCQMFITMDGVVATQFSGWPTNTACQATLDASPSGEAGGALSNVQQLSLLCPDTVMSDDQSCVPRCGEALHGVQLLANIHGEDVKYTCELHQALYSWLGGATDGGFIGTDIKSFISAVYGGVPRQLADRVDNLSASSAGAIAARHA